MFYVEQVEDTKGSSFALSGGGGAGGSIIPITKQAHVGDKYAVNIAGGTADHRHISSNKDFGDSMASRVVIPQWLLNLGLRLDKFDTDVKL